MPIIDVTVEPSDEPTRVLAWVCTICGANSVHVDTTGSALVALEAFETLGWLAMPASWRRLPSGDEVVCDRCKVLPDVAHQLLAEGKAHPL